MKGALVGDYIGSIYEFCNTRDKDFPLIDPHKEITDDSVCTLAVADAILRGKSYSDSLREVCLRHPNPMGAYGNGFMNWLLSEFPAPYNSCGNGSAMRVSAVAWAFDDEKTMLAEAKKSAECTHNHPEGIKGAVATAHAIWFFRHHKDDLCGFKSLMSFYYPGWESFDKPFNDFNAICQNTVPLCIQEVAKGTSFSSTMRSTVLRGGDTDTNCAIAGAMAGARWGVPDDLWQAAYKTADSDLQSIVDEFVGKFDVKG